MRPTKLEIHGLTSYRQPVEVDFTELDLFAITGPTGAGKSSLVDAITYALFGKAPRMGRITELISHGIDRVKVTLEFTAGSESYRVHRSSARKGQSPVQLERLDGEDWQPIADRVADVNSEIEGLLRMDYDAFIRSVLLPQGEFAEFLCGDRDERRKVLDGLLQLGVYALMGQAANAIAAREGDAADHIASRLQSELSDATPEALKDARVELESLKAHAEEVASIRGEVQSAAETVQRLNEARSQEARVRSSLSDAEQQLKEAQEVAATGKDQEAAHRKAIDGLNKQLASNQYDEAAYLRLRDAGQRAQELAEEETRATDIEAQSTRLEKSLAEADAAAKKCGASHEKAKKESEQAQHAYIEARMTNAAAVLQRELKPGDRCPVCGGEVSQMQPVSIAKFEEAKATAEKAKTAEATAQREAQAAEAAREAANARLDAHASAVAEARERVESRRKALADSLAGEMLTGSEIAARVQALDAAREERDRLRDELDKETEALNAVISRSAEAAGNLARWQADVDRCTSELKAATEATAALATSLRDAASSSSWDDVLRALDSEADPAPIVQRRLEAAQLQERAAATAIGSCEERIRQIERDIELAEKLRGEEKEHREAATLAHSLGGLLRADRFPSFIRERALEALAADGSVRLQEISRGRYDFAVDGQDFLILDRWNGGERRSVRTLSGGETFLASLALALALAEQLPALSGDGVGAALESLFIDEGFSHLDADTLDDVATALEVLGQDRRRLVGVVTHVPALADRMPARIVVHKTQQGSTISVE